MAETFWISYLVVGAAIFLAIHAADRWRKWGRYDTWTHVLVLLALMLFWPFILIAFIVEVL